MIGRLFRREPDERAALFAEAQTLLDDGLDAEFVLGLYPEDAAWLAPLLDTSALIDGTFAESQPSYYFEASLKAKFLGAAREKQSIQLAPVSPVERVRTAFAAATVMVGAGALGVLTLGFVTANSAVPGDWNYTFKLANERMQYSLSRGNDRVNVQISHTEIRVQEFAHRSTRGEVSQADLERLEREYLDLKAQFERMQQVDDAQRARVKSLAETSSALLADLRARQAGLETAVASTQRTLNDTAAAAGVGSVATVAPIATPEPSPKASPSASPAPAGTPSAGETPVPSATATP